MRMELSPLLWTTIVAVRFWPPKPSAHRRDPNDRTRTIVCAEKIRNQTVSTQPDTFASE